jgi:cysteine desulfurase
LTTSAHKFGGPRGIGFLFVRNEIPIIPLFFGGQQERGLRPGTENLAAIAGCSKALECVSLPAEDATRNLLESRLMQLLPSARVNGSTAKRLPHILSLTIPDMPSERLLPRLSRLDVYVSARAACAGGERTPSHVLLAMGLSEADAGATIRFSTGFGTKLSEIEEAIHAIDFVMNHEN